MRDDIIVQVENLGYFYEGGSSDGVLIFSQKANSIINGIFLNIDLDRREYSKIRHRYWPTGSSHVRLDPTPEEKKVLDNIIRNY